MKGFLLVLFFVACTYCCFAQKPSLDTFALNKWPFLEEPLLSNDGNYIVYKIHSQDDRSRGVTKMVIQSLHTKWKVELEVTGSSTAVFADNDRFVVFRKTMDSLAIIALGDDKITYIPQVVSFKLPDKGSREFLAYRLSTPDSKLILLHLDTKKSAVYEFVEDYGFSEDGNVVLLTRQIAENTGRNKVLQWLDISNMKISTIWQQHDEKQRNWVLTTADFDASGQQLALIMEEDGINTIWYYRLGNDSIEPLVDKQLSGIFNGFKIGTTIYFSTLGGKLFFYLEPPERPKLNDEMVKVDVWNYRDIKLQTLQLEELSQQKSYLAVVNIKSRKIIQLEGEGDIGQPLSSYEVSNEKFIVLFNRTGDEYEGDWNEFARETIYLVSTEDATRREIVSGISKSIRCYGLSPGGRFVLYYDGTKNDYYVYNVVSGFTYNITKRITTNWIWHECNDRPDSAFSPLGLAAWFNGDSTLFIYDQFDIWSVDPRGDLEARNITNFYGKKNNIQFQFPSRNGTIDYLGDEVLLSAFDRGSKENGFYCIKLNSRENPVKLTMGPYIYNTNVALFPPIKAENADIYVVRRMSAVESPNYFWTRNFKTFNRLTDLQPEKNYNWLTTELHTFKTLDGRTTHGILYKPDSFNPQRKYPIIFHFYERMSDRLNQFIRPEPAEGDINIPWFVSQGYLVFTPDIYYQIGKIGESVKNTVVAAVNYLSGLGCIDLSKMGLQGHSFGGYGVNCLITRTHLFSAAVSAAGICDIVSLYGSGNQHGRSIQYFERYQGRMGTSLWKGLDKYLENSPVLFADKITTPLLMMNNKNDHWGVYSQGIEFFTSLRRMKKKVWMLQYDDEGHTLGSNKAQIDFTLRMTQFFNHYLKNEPAPVWMTKGIEASKKAVDSGLAIDLYEGQP